MTTMNCGHTHPYTGAILIVDDERAIGRLMEQWLAADGYHTGFARSFAQAQEALSQGTYDLVTLDIMMPDISGLAILSWIREHYPGIAVVMATALGDFDTVLEAMRLGATGYLLKPFNMELVSVEVRRAMERQRLVAENRAYQQKLEQRVAEQTGQIRQAYLQLERRVRELEGRDRLVHYQMTGPTVDAAGAEVLAVVDQVLGARPTILYRCDSRGRDLRPVAGRGLRGPGTAEAPPDLVGMAGTPAAPDFAAVTHAAGQRQRQETANGQVCLPLLYRDEVLGVLWIRCLDEPGRGEALETLERVAREAAVLLWSARVAQDLDSGQIEIDQLLEMD